MRKLLVFTAALGLAGAANAQNSLDATQTGDGNVVAGVDGAAAALQSGSNSAVISQTAGLTRNGDPTGGHTAYISQIGGLGADGQNQINLSQSFGTNALGAKGSHTAILRQEGSGNVIGGYVDGEVTAADPAEQDSRSDRTADVSQLGDRNRASFEDGAVDVDQIGSDNVAVSTGKATVQYQEGDGNEAYNFGTDATQTQVGDGNLAYSSGWVSGGVTVQTQTGSDNTSRVDRLRGGDKTTATTVQTGDGNEVYAAFNGQPNLGNGSDLLSTQIGTGNFAEVEFLSQDNQATILQDGSTNSVVVTQQ
jgi:hypothetical protein